CTCLCRSRRLGTGGGSRYAEQLLDERANEATLGRHRGAPTAQEAVHVPCLERTDQCLGNCGCIVKCPTGERPSSREPAAEVPAGQSGQTPLAHAAPDAGGEQ